MPLRKKTILLHTCFYDTRYYSVQAHEDRTVFGRHLIWISKRTPDILLVVVSVVFLNPSSLKTPAFGRHPIRISDRTPAKSLLKVSTIFLNPSNLKRPVHIRNFI
jgi:hypothetical protein